MRVKTTDHTDNTELFASAPVRKAVIALVVPTVISQLITVVYNMADTFFIGQVGDPNQVAAVSLCMPAFMLLTGMANLFGIGGASLISRSLGVGNHRRARATASFSIWTAGAVALLYGLLLYALRGILLPAIGADADTYVFCEQYIFWTITVGAVPTVLNQALAHLVRSEGCSKQASFGMALGGVLNMLLDPIFIFPLGLDVAGAAIATMLSNLIATIYFLLLIRRRGTSTNIKLHPKYYSLQKQIPKEVLLVGLPSCVMNLMGVASNVTLNKLLVSYANTAVAGIGVAKKVDMLTFAIINGMSQGALPLIGYNYSAKNYQRMLSAIKTTLLYSFVVTFISAVLLFTCAAPIVHAFIADSETVRYGQLFQRIICITGPLVSLTMISITVFQSVGKKLEPLLLSLLRKGGLDIPLMFLMDKLAGIEGIVWATPIADCCALIVAVMLFIPFWRRFSQAIPAEAVPELSNAPGA